MAKVAKGGKHKGMRAAKLKPKHAARRAAMVTQKHKARRVLRSSGLRAYIAYCGANLLRVDAGLMARRTWAK